MKDRIAHRWSLALPAPLHAKIEEYAKANLMSVSEVLRHLEKVYIERRPKPRRDRAARRVSYYSDPAAHKAFTAAVGARKTTVAAAIEAAFDEVGVNGW